MEAIYSNDVDTFLEWLDDKILWVSSLTGYALSGHDSIRKVMNRMPVHEYMWEISDEQYTVVAEDALSCTASGSYTLMSSCLAAQRLPVCSKFRQTAAAHFARIPRQGKNPSRLHERRFGSCGFQRRGAL